MTTRIGILGIGGVGGFIGGLLAEKYSNRVSAMPDENTALRFGVLHQPPEIIFIARPVTGSIIRANGLKLLMGDIEKTIHPDLVSSDPDETGRLDILICTTKSYDLEESLKPLKSCIHPDTIILPLLNGVDSAERIKTLYPQAQLAEGCIYIVSRIIEPGVVMVTGNTHSLHFGSDLIPAGKLEKLQQVFKEAGINSFLSDNIQKTVWEKFFFISAIASLTSYLGQPMGEILANPGSKKTLTQLMQEFLEVAKAHGINFDDDIFEKSLAKMEKLPYDTTSSMHNDFKKGGRTEYRSLTEYVVNLGNQLGVDTKTYDQVLEALKQRDSAGGVN